MLYEDDAAMDPTADGDGVENGGVSVIAESQVGLYVAIGLTIGLVLPYMQITDAGQRRLQNINEALPYVIDLMALAMSAGMDFPGAIRQVVDKSTNPNDPIIVELKRILRELSIGRTRKQALQDFAERADQPALGLAGIFRREEIESLSFIGGFMISYRMPSMRKRTCMRSA